MLHNSCANYFSRVYCIWGIIVWLFLHPLLSVRYNFAFNFTCNWCKYHIIWGLTRVESIKVLGVTFSRKFSVLQHVDNLLAGCSQSLFTLWTLWQHGLPDNALGKGFQAVVINRLTMRLQLGGDLPLQTTEID